MSAAERGVNCWACRRRLRRSPANTAAKAMKLGRLNRQPSGSRIPKMSINGAYELRKSTSLAKRVGIGTLTLAMKNWALESPASPLRAPEDLLVEADIGLLLAQG